MNSYLMFTNFQRLLLALPFATINSITITSRRLDPSSVRLPFYICILGKQRQDLRTTLRHSRRCRIGFSRGPPQFGEHYLYASSFLPSKDKSWRRLGLDLGKQIEDLVGKQRQHLEPLSIGFEQAEHILRR